MNMESLGLLAGVLTSFSFLPQVIKLLKTKSVKDISLCMYIVNCTGQCIWLVFSVYENIIPLFISSAISLLFSGSILAMKLLEIARSLNKPSFKQYNILYKDIVRIASNVSQLPIFSTNSFWKYKNTKDKTSRNLWALFSLVFLASVFITLYSPFCFRF